MNITYGLKGLKKLETEETRNSNQFTQFSSLFRLLVYSVFSLFRGVPGRIWERGIRSVFVEQWWQGKELTARK